MNESVSAEGNSTSPAGPAPSGDMSVDLRDNQLDELPSQAAPSSSTVFGSGPDSLQGATVNSATQSVLAGLVNPNLPNSQPDYDVDLSDSCDIFNDHTCLNSESSALNHGNLTLIHQRSITLSENNSDNSNNECLNDNTNGNSSNSNSNTEMDDIDNDDSDVGSDVSIASLEEGQASDYDDSFLGLSPFF